MYYDSVSEVIEEGIEQYLSNHEFKLSDMRNKVRRRRCFQTWESRLKRGFLISS